MLSLVGAAYYGVVFLACILGFRAARGAPNWHLAVWGALVILFAALIVWRVLSLEDILRTELRDLLRGSHAYGQRRGLQLVLAGGLALIGAIAATVAIRMVRTLIRGRRDRFCFIALLSGGAMLGLVLLRLISWHATDLLLFGPLKLNWFLDLGLATSVAACALLYATRARKRR